MTIEISYEEALAGLRAAIALKGEGFTYDATGGCKYYRNGEPSCIVGHVLAPLGLPRDVDDLSDGTGVYDLIDSGFLRVDRRTAYLLANSQEHQDMGEPWGMVVESAVDGIENGAWE